MSKSRDLNPMERVLAQWAMEALNGPSIPDFDPEFSASFPNLWVLLTWPSVGDVERSPGSLSIAADGTGWRVSYYDPSARRRLAVVSPSLLEGLKKLDQEVTSPSAAWSGGKRKSTSFRKPKDV